MSLLKLAAVLENEAGFNLSAKYRPDSSESEALLAQTVKLSKKDAAVLDVPERCPLDLLFHPTEVTYYPAPDYAPMTETLLGIRYTDPGPYPEQPRIYPTPWTAHDREEDYRSAWAALEVLEADSAEERSPAQEGSLYA